jgi:leucyl-tRNA synthetase
VQVDGRLRDRITIRRDAPEDAVIAAALGAPRVVAAIGAAGVARTVVVAGKLVNVVTQREDNEPQLGSRAADG